VDPTGCLFAIVPLRALLKLTPWSELEWSCDLAAHHDLAIDGTGTIRVLSEAPRRVLVDSRTYTIIDNLVTTVDPRGVVRAEVSLYDILRTDPGLRRLIDDSVERRAAFFQRMKWPNADLGVKAAVAEETRWILETAADVGDRRLTLQRLRDLPGSPCDVMHTNTLELVGGQPTRWSGRSDTLICLRELNAIAAIDLSMGNVAWSWGPGELSGPHQPSLLPDGKVLVFDNGVRTKRTRIIVVDPSTQEIVWSWSADPPESFYCPLAGGCEQLPDGNLLVTNSTAGSAFEISMNGDIVWQMKLPVDVYGADRGRVSIYRMAAIAPSIVSILGQTYADPNPTATVLSIHRQRFVEGSRDRVGVHL
jgi:hypothetical protein